MALKIPYRILVIGVWKWVVCGILAVLAKNVTITLVIMSYFVII